MKIVLLNSASLSKPKDHMQRVLPHPRVGVAMIAACLREVGHEVCVIDPAVENLPLEGLVHKILECSPDLVGFSVFSEEIYDAAAIAGGLKRRSPRITTVLGGYHVSAIPDEALNEFPDFDIGVIGEGEVPMVELAAGRSAQGTAGVVYRHNGLVRVNAPKPPHRDFSSLPMPAWDLYRVEAYGYRLPVEASRSCPYTCPFCFQATDRKVRFKSPEYVVNEIEYNVRHYAVKEVSFFSAGTFPFRKEHALAICLGLRERVPGIKWLTTTRVDALDRELLVEMKRAGCIYISLGIESGDQEILDRCQKGITLEKAEETIRLIHDVGIESELCFIIGLPYETRKSLANTRRFAMKMRPYTTLASFAILTPYPGIPVLKKNSDFFGGYVFASGRWDQYSKHSGLALRHKNFSVAQLRRYQLLLYLQYYFGSFRKIIHLLKSKNFWEIVSLRRLLALIGRAF